MDSDGGIQDQMEEQEGFINADFTLDPDGKIQGQPHAYSHYVYPGSAGRAVFDLIESLGRLGYNIS